MVNSWAYKRPDQLDARERAELRWYHFSLLGGLIFGRHAANRVIGSLSTTYEQKRIAQEIVKLTEELERLIRDERVNC